MLPFDTALRGLASTLTPPLSADGDVLMDSEKAGVDESDVGAAGRMDDSILGGWNQDDHLGGWLARAEAEEAEVEADEAARTGRATVTAAGRICGVRDSSVRSDDSAVGGEG